MGNRVIHCSQMGRTRPDQITHGGKDIVPGCRSRLVAKLVALQSVEVGQPFVLLQLLFIQRGHYSAWGRAGWEGCGGSLAGCPAEGC